MTQVRKPGLTNIKSVVSTFYENAVGSSLIVVGICSTKVVFTHVTVNHTIHGNKHLFQNGRLLLTCIVLLSPTVSVFSTFLFPCCKPSPILHCEFCMKYVLSPKKVHTAYSCQRYNSLFLLTSWEQSDSFNCLVLGRDGIGTVKRKYCEIQQIEGTFPWNQLIMDKIFNQ